MFGKNILVLSAVLLIGATTFGGCDSIPGEEAVSAESRPHNVLLVVVDTLRADRLGLYGYPIDTSPALDRWAESAVVFENAFAASPWTLASMASILTGQYPGFHGGGARLGGEGREASYAPLAGDALVLPEVFQRQGFVTGAVVNNVFFRPDFGLQQGFDSYDYGQGTPLRRRRANKLVARLLEQLDSRLESRSESPSKSGTTSSAPFFRLLHLLDPHLPYDARGDARGLFTHGLESDLTLPVDFSYEEIRAINGGNELSEGDRAFISAAYDEEIRFTDENLGWLMEELESRGLLETTTVILTADHGEELFEHGGFEHGHALYQEVVHVPLLVWSPGLVPGRVSQPVSHVDIAPTVLDLLELPPLEQTHGRSFAAALRPDFVEDSAATNPIILAQSMLYGQEQEMVVEWPLKLHYRDLSTVVDGSRGSELFDLLADPTEQFPLTEPAADTIAALVERLRATAPAVERDPSSGGFEIDEQTRQELKELGYSN